MSNRRIGIDQRGDSLLIATTVDESGRTTVLRLDRLHPSELNGGALVPEDSIALAVPDSQVMVKMVRVNPAGSISQSDRIRFELLQSVLESEDTFNFDSAPAGSADRRLGLIFRRQHISELTDRLGLRAALRENRLSFQSRAVALGKGYLTFGLEQNDPLIVLVDLAGDAASICFIYERKVADVASLSLSGHDLSGEPGLRRFAVDLKTIINYKQSMLLDAGISVPPARVLLSGEFLSDTVRDAVQSHFSVEVAGTRLNEGFFGALDSATRDSLPLYAAALGLTVN